MRQPGIGILLRLRGPVQPARVFIIGLLFDVLFVPFIIFRTYPLEKARISISISIFTLFNLGLDLFHEITKMWSDEREQKTAYWTGIALQWPGSVPSLGLFVKGQERKGSPVRNLVGITSFPPFFLFFPRLCHFYFNTIEHCLVIITVVVNFHP